MPALFKSCPFRYPSSPKGKMGAGMARAVLASLIVLMVVAGCARVRDSRINPLNWFGNSESARSTAQVSAEAAAEPTDPRPLVEEVTALRIDRTPEGAIITAVGLPPTQGFWDPELVRASGGDAAQSGGLVFEFRIERPLGQQQAGTAPSREVTVGQFISNQSLEGVRSITVQGRTTQRTVRR